MTATLVPKLLPSQLLACTVMFQVPSHSTSFSVATLSISSPNLQRLLLLFPVWLSLLMSRCPAAGGPIQRIGVLRFVESARVRREVRVWVARMVGGGVPGGVREMIMGMG